MSECHLCELPISRPVTTPGVEGEFCCRGCLEVARALDDVEAEPGSSVEAGDDAVPDGAAETFLAVDGMHCTTCEAFLGLRADAVEAVYRIEASYGMGAARVCYDPDAIEEEALPEALSGYGYRFRLRDEDGEAAARDRKRAQAQRLVVGGFLSMLVMQWYIFSLYPGYLGFETGVLAVDATTSVGAYLPLIVVGFLTTVILLYTGGPVLRGAWVSLRARRPNVDLLVSVAALAAYAYSTLALAMGTTHLYYDVTVAVVMVVALGRYYEELVRSQATALLAEVTGAREREATRLVDGGRETVPVEALEPGDRLVVAPGERVPVDGTVVEGVAAVDESVLTGESFPVTKSAGESVIGGSVVTDDALVVAVGPRVESTVDRIATALWEIQSATPGVQRLADALATVFVPLVLVLGTAVAAWQLLTGGSVAAAMLAGLVVVVVSCPCALGLATPLAVSAGLRDALQRGIVVTNETVFEVAPEADVVVFDKTGTLTAGEMTVSNVTGDDRTLRLAAAVERFSSHPVADSIVEAVVDGWDGPLRADGGAAAAPGERSHNPDEPTATEAIPDTSEFTRHPGEGVSATVEGHRVVVGTPALVEREAGPIPPELPVDEVEAAGELAVVVGWGGAGRGVIAVGDRERETWEAALEAFADREVAVVTGDDSPSADRFREHPAVDRVFTGVPPDGKAETVRRLSALGTTVMVGDGTNDAPALAAADLGIAVGDGTARAVDAADVVVADGDLTALETTFELATGTRRRIRENVGWAFFYNAVAIPLAVAGLINPFFAAVAMAASSLLVVSNSRRSVL